MKKKNKFKEEIVVLQRKVYRSSIICSILCFFVITFACIIMFSNILSPKVDETRLSYISFYNQNDTDMLKINDIKKMSISKGKSESNNCFQELAIVGDKNLEYEIVLYSIKNEIPNKYVMFSLYNEKNTIVNNIDALSDSGDGGKILYQGKVNEKKNILRMWVSDKYKKKISDTSFEIKIREK